MIQSEEDKRLVDQYKQTNTALRKQLMNLNNEIDKILTKKTNKVGLQKLPSVSKKITDPNVIQHEVENLRKRAQLLEKDAETYKNKAGINYYQKVREVEGQIQEAENQMDQCKKQIKQLERKDKIYNAQAAKEHNPNSKWEKRIASLHQQISRYQKIQKQLTKQLNFLAASQNKNIQYLQQLASKHQEAVSKKQKERKKSPPPINTSPITHSKTSQIGEEEWKELKKQFLIFKESKQNQQWNLNQENQRLRGEVNEWKRKIKEKKKRIEAIMQNEQKNRHRQMKVYSTLQQQKSKGRKNIRYRDRNNSIQYNTKN